MRVGGGARPPLFTISTITYKVVVYAPAERAESVPLFLLYPYVLCAPQYKPQIYCTATPTPSQLEPVFLVQQYSSVHKNAVSLCGPVLPPDENVRQRNRVFISIPPPYSSVYVRGTVDLGSLAL